jgi:hypothetical protein
MTPNTLTVNEMDVGSCEFRATLEAVCEKSGWDQKYGKLPKGTGIGISSILMLYPTVAARLTAP